MDSDALQALEAIITKSGDPAAIAALAAVFAQQRALSALTSDYTYSLRKMPNGETEIEWVSDAFTKITGYLPEAIVRRDGHVQAQLVHPEDLPIAAARLNALFAGEAGVAEYRVVTRSGEIRWMSDHGVPMKDASGTVLRVLGAARDITAQRLAEDALRKSEARYRMLAETSRDMLSESGPDGTCVYMSPACRDILGFEPEEMEGTPALAYAHPDDSANAKARFANNLTASGHSLPGITRVRRKDGSYVWMESTAHVERDPVTAEVIAVRYSARDVSERKKLEAQLVAADRMASLGRLAAAVGHEINNPLTYMLGHLDVLQRDLQKLGGMDPESAEKLAEKLLVVRDGATRIRDIVRDLKMFSRGEDVPRGPIDIHRVLDQCLAMVAGEVRHRARITKQYACQGSVLGNEARLGQVFLNLLVNAAQSLPEGDVDGNEIRVVTRPGVAGQVVIEICDTGAGIPEDIRERIFEPFFTTKAPGVGTGLGLSISHHLITALGGTIAVDGNAGGGTVFRVTLGSDKESVRAAST